MLKPKFWLWSSFWTTGYFFGVGVSPYCFLVSDRTSHCIPCWPRTHGHPPVVLEYVLGLQVWTTVKYSCFFRGEGCHLNSGLTSWPDWLAVEIFACTFLALGIQVCAAVPSFYLGTVNPNWSPATCPASTLLTNHFSICPPNLIFSPSQKFIFIF